MWSPVIFPSSFTGVLSVHQKVVRPREENTGKQWIGAESLKFFPGVADLLCGLHQVSPSFSVLALKMKKICYFGVKPKEEISLRIHQQSSLDQQMGAFVWHSLSASQTSHFYPIRRFSCQGVLLELPLASGHGLCVLPALWTLIKASGRRSQQHTKYMSAQLFSQAELCLAWESSLSPSQVIEGVEALFNLSGRADALTSTKSCFVWGAKGSLQD